MIALINTDLSDLGSMRVKCCFHEGKDLVK